MFFVRPDVQWRKITFNLLSQSIATCCKAARTDGSFLKNKCIAPSRVHVSRESKTAAKFWIPCDGLWILGTGFRILCQWKLDSWIPIVSGFQILWPVFWIQKPRIPDSTANTCLIRDFTSTNFLDSGIWIPLYGAKCIFIFTSDNLLHSRSLLTIIPRVQMGSQSIVHEAEGRMGYWLRGHEGERNNCFY